MSRNCSWLNCDEEGVAGELVDALGVLKPRSARKRLRVSCDA